MRLRARHYRTAQLVDVVCANGVVQSIAPVSPDDKAAGWIAPAMFDLQINGALGKAFVSPSLTIANVRLVVAECHRHGIAGLCPTLITGSFDALAHGFWTLRQACEQDRAFARAMPCFHLEGPYISAEDGPRGAHPREHVRAPDREEFRRWQDAAGGRIRLVTLAPEHDEALAFIEWLVIQGIVVAIGHTAASPARIRDAIKAGARLSTHLGNGSHAMLPRHDNYLWEQLASDDLLASFIPDGHHLPDALLRVLLRVKTRKRLIVTCDASSLAGLSPGRYDMWGQELEMLPGGKVVVPGTPFLAGSGVFTDRCVDKLLSLGEVTLADALDMAGAQPRALLGLPAVDVVVGAPADLVLFDYEPSGSFRVTGTIVAGQRT
jgi:N-acetylglucosamine-6-phosphate deacetylase